ncbi:MAG: hypothetical protein E6J16_10665 [Chloroflexota bacterium]|nr:MAG: hypothetical protein E6J16_10665 [Chloroflexota bacterium]TMD87166.1 MAG: hypothetical protein E6I78_03395 [Chloroflexota bacterium]
MPVVEWVVKVGYAVETRDAYLGSVREIFEGPPQSAQGIFVSSEPYMRVVDRGQPDLYIPFEEIVDVSAVKQAVYLKRSVNEINALGWTRDPRRPGAAPVPYFPNRQSAPAAKPDANGGVPPRPLVESGAWSPGEAAPRSEPGKRIRIGDRFKPGDPIPVPGQYMCTVCRFRKHSRQFLEENPDGRFPPAHHPGALWELEDLRP